MLFHASFAVRDPEHAARIIAELWRGEALPFPPVIDGSWIAMAGDARNTAIEFYPAGTVLVPGDGDTDVVGIRSDTAPPLSATHVAIATDLDPDAVAAIAAREGWLAKYRKRGGRFGVIEFWVENAIMIEVLTPAMQREYLTSVSIEQWRAMLEQGPHEVAA